MASRLDFSQIRSLYVGTIPSTTVDTNNLIVTGNVGIGTTSPTGTYGKLTVAGGIHITNDNNAKLEIGRYSVGAPNSYIKLGASSNSLRFTNNTDVADLMELTNSGNLGLGVTPSAWDTTASKAIQLNGGSLWGFSTSQMNLLQNAFYNTSGDIAYINSASASAYRQISGVHSWYTAPSGTAGNAITFTQAMTLAASGNVLIGTTADGGYKLDVSGTGRFSGSLTANDFLAGNAGLNVGNYNFYTQTISGAMGILGHNVRASTSVANQVDVVNGGWISSMIKQYYSEGITFHTDTTVYGAGAVYPMAASERMRITSAGNVGIGTTSPQDKLEIKSGYLRMYDPSSSTGAGYLLQWSSDNGGSNVTYAGIDAITTSAGVRTGDLRFLTSSAGAPTEKMRITSGGNVGIGTTSPDATGFGWKVLTIKGGASAGQAGVLELQSGTSDTDNQNLGIIAFLDGSSRNAQIGAKRATSTSTSYLDFYTNAGAGLVERMRITSDGSLLVGATNPDIGGSVKGTIIRQDGSIVAARNIASPFHYQTPISADRMNTMGDGIMYSMWREGVFQAGIGATNTSNMTFFTGDNTSASEKMRIAAAGNVGIGTTNPLNLLHVSQASANTIFRLGNNASYDQFIYFNGGNDWSLGMDYSNSNAFVLSNSSSIGTNDRVVVTTAGNVGIGTTAPSYKFNVITDAVAGRQNLAAIDRTAQNFITFTNPQYSVEASMGLMLRVFPQSDARQGAGIIASGGSLNGETDLSLFVSSGVGSSVSYGALNIKGDTGNVGIGTTAPAFTSGDGLEIQRSSATATLRLDSGVFATELRAYTDGTFLGQLSNSYLDLGTDNSTKVRITGAGNVGIGTTSPAAKLSLGANDFMMVSVGSGGKAGILFHETGTATATDVQYGAKIFYDETLDVLQLSTRENNVDKLGIAIFRATGNVGIGTTAPAAKLHVYTPSSGTAIVVGRASGNSSIKASADADGGYLSLDSTGTATIINHYVSDNVWLVTGGGNVGIGTTGPVSKLQVNHSSAPSFNANGGANALTLVRTGGSGAAGTFGAGLVFSQPYLTDDASIGVGGIYGVKINGSGTFGGGLAFFAQPNSAADMFEVMRITSAGNVGIGTTAPDEKLHVDGSTLITYNNSFQSTNSVGNKAILARVSPTSGIINYAEYATATNLNGFVIGSDDARVKGNIATDSLEFITNTSTRMTVLSSGNVGINTTTPGSTLHVIGDVLIQTGALGVGVNPNATDGRIDASNDIVAFSTSDRRLKENITPIANALEKVRSLTGVEFDWKEETKSVHGYEGHDVGVIAQDVQAVLPEAVRTNDSGYLSVRYEKMIALLVEANKELADRVEQLEKLIK